MSFSEAIDKFAPAFVKAQAECENAKKSNENAAVKQNGKASKYAGLPEVVTACLPACHANSIGVTQELGETIDGKMHITTLLLHSSGQWMEAHGSIPLPKSDPQGYGSASTYARRYHLAAVMGIIQEDDDGNAASRPVVQDIAHPEVIIDEAQFATLTTLIEQSGADTRAFCTFYKIDAVKNLPASKFDHAATSLRNKLNPKKESA
jgi:hypothetical protein